MTVYVKSLILISFLLFSNHGVAGTLPDDICSLEPSQSQAGKYLVRINRVPASEDLAYFSALQKINELVNAGACKDQIVFLRQIGCYGECQTASDCIMGCSCGGNGLCQ
jgi:hypothetical protein